jgi:hypothetical protein
LQAAARFSDVVERFAVHFAWDLAPAHFEEVGAVGDARHGRADVVRDTGHEPFRRLETQLLNAFIPSDVLGRHLAHQEKIRTLSGHVARAPEDVSVGTRRTPLDGFAGRHLFQQFPEFRRKLLLRGAEHRETPQETDGDGRRGL